MRILMGFRYGNIGPADRVKYALKKMGHEVIAVGPSTDPVVRQDLEEPDILESQDAGIYYYDTKKIIDKFGQFDFILQVEPGTYFYNLDTAKCPNAIWVIDTLLLQNNPFIQRMGGGEYIDQLGRIFTSKYNHIPQYHEWGIKHVSHLPLACDPDMHKEVKAERVYDIVFLGNTTYEERGHFLDLLRSKYNTFIGTGFIFDFYCSKVAQAKICFNHGHVGEMNMRFFELMAMGAFQICNIVHGQELLGFEDRIHLVNYISDEDLINTIGEFLHGGDEPFLVEKRSKIAQTGKQKALAGHTYQHRAEEILEVCGLC